MFDDVRLHSQGRTFIFPRWLRWGGKPRPSLPQGEGAQRQTFQPSSRGLSLIGGHSNLHQVEQV